MSASPSDFSSLSLSEIAQLAAERKLPPVAQWNPSHCGHSDMRIARDGSWYHQGSPITRPAMVRLFSTILRREEDGSYVLVTPVEKLDIDVEDAPFVAREMRVSGTGSAMQLAFRLNEDSFVSAGPKNTIRVVEGPDGPRPYLHVRDGLDALISRAIYYELVQLALENSSTPPGVWSNGTFFSLEASTCC